MNGESEGGDYNEVMCARWGEPGGEWVYQMEAITASAMKEYGMTIQLKNWMSRKTACPRSSVRITWKPEYTGPPHLLRRPPHYSENPGYRGGRRRPPHFCVNEMIMVSFNPDHNIHRWVKIYWSLPKISLGNLLKICWAGFVDNLSELHRPLLRELRREFDKPQRRAFVDI